MTPRARLAILCVPLCALATSPAVTAPVVEISDDGHETAVVEDASGPGRVIARRSEVPYGAVPDWQNDLRRQVGALQVADMNGDGWADVVVGCYISQSYPPYDHWENLIYFNVGGTLEASPSWVSADEVSTGDIQVALINDDPYPDVFAANGGFEMAASVIYWGGPGGPSTSPGWTSAEPGRAWNNYALPFDYDHDGDTDVITANQGNSPTDPYRPLYIFRNTGGVLDAVPYWQSAEASLQNCIAPADYDHDGWEDLAVSKWANFESGIYRNLAGVIQVTPAWTTGDTDTDKGVAWADVDGDTWADLALGHDPTQLWGNSAGTLSVVWTSSATYFGHSELRFHDVDRDGDQDLAEIHFSNGQTHIYLNEGGVLESVPSWTYDSPTVGTAIAFGDLNGDAWPDLVVGSSGDPSVEVFFAQPLVSVPADPGGGPIAALRPCRPNPAAGPAEIGFRLSTEGRVRLGVFDADGRLVTRLVDGPLAAGEHAVRWDGRLGNGGSAPPGVYLYRLEIGGRSASGRLTLIR